MILIGLLISCTNQPPEPTVPLPEPTKPPITSIKCKPPRPQVCTKEYRPVCATRDNGVRCIITPCQSTEQITYSTGCTACADPRVYSYRQGACK